MSGGRVPRLIADAVRGNGSTRRSRRDVALGRALRIGHRYRDRSSGDVYQVAQVFRQDCIVVLTRGHEDSPEGRTVRWLRFEQLRAGFVWIVDQQEVSPA